MRARRLAAMLGLAVVALAGCQPGGEDVVDVEALGGFGVPTQPEADEIPGERVPVEAVVVERANGCIDLELSGGEVRWAVWPTGSQASDGGAFPVLDGATVAEGEIVTGTGALVDADALPGWGGDGYFAAFGGFCGAQERGVVVLDEASVREP